MSLNIIASSSLLLSVSCNKCDCDECEFCDPEDPSSVNEGMLFVFLAGSGGMRKEKVELPAPVTVLNLSSVRFRGGSLAVDGVVTGVWARLLFLARAPWRSKKSSASLSLALTCEISGSTPDTFRTIRTVKKPLEPVAEGFSQWCRPFFHERSDFCVSSAAAAATAAATTPGVDPGPEYSLLINALAVAPRNSQVRVLLVGRHHCYLLLLLFVSLGFSSLSVRYCFFCYCCLLSWTG